LHTTSIDLQWIFVGQPFVVGATEDLLYNLCCAVDPLHQLRARHMQGRELCFAIANIRQTTKGRPYVVAEIPGYVKDQVASRVRQSGWTSPEIFFSRVRIQLASYRSEVLEHYLPQILHGHDSPPLVQPRFTRATPAHNLRSLSGLR
jgi:hypothetical protein